MAGYGLIASESTVQVLSPTLVNDVVYCTIATSPSGVIASIPVQQSVFDANAAGAELTNFANAIEQIMALPEVVAGVGSQTIDQNGLLADNVVFTVQFVINTPPQRSITADAVVGVDSLNFSDAEIGRFSLANVEAQITAVYDSLANAAGA